ncbi:hypothetical protein AD006_28410 (plasmid) [Pseudonocardia sp. EC080610-09]|uniref:C4-dicarboxylate TRAP transporter substrate-binding protein n=1 Tax=unclassified Pseudonocardia TaxID=2619320 RepID=UPI000705B59C|nr:MULTISPECIES: C4-dicarboxylate TRAP transporter substrate-binding protein [unclassified Pseudonocardia]ALL79256.1 hypothetical protein AD006_28410 [Pseudonocardia sp. EC080610-09]ALL85226.1 hypothetical protein AD017_28800 [Pseudonocardia sp. EC080619-01]
MEPITLRYASFTAPSAAGPFRRFAEEVTERTRGKIRFDDYWGGSLLTAEETAEGVGGGVADMGMFGPDKYPSQFPVSHWITYLNQKVDPQAPLGLMQGFAAITQFVLTDDLITAQLREANLKPLFTFTPITTYNLACTEPVRTLDEARGKRVRSGGSFIDGDIEALGMIPVNLPTGDIYTGLQRGVIDCTVAMPKFMVAYGLWEVAPHYTRVPMNGYSQYEVINLDVWESLPADAQQAIEASLYTWYEGLLREEGIRYEERLRTEGPAEHGMTFHEPAAEMVDAVRVHHGRVVEDMVADPPEGLEDPAGTIARYDALLADWDRRLRSLGYGDPALSEAGTALDLTRYRDEVVGRVLPSPVDPG